MRAQALRAGAVAAATWLAIVPLSCRSAQEARPEASKPGESITLDSFRDLIQKGSL